MTLRPVDDLPLVHDADLKAHVTGRTATVTIGQAAADTPAGRKLNISDFVFEVPDMAPKPSPARVKFKIDGPVPAAAEILASDKLSEFSGTLIDPNSSKGTISAVVTLGLPIKRELTKADTTYNITADLGGFAADRLVMNQKLEANTLKVVANNEGYQVKGDVRINGQAASLDYRKPSEGDADIKLQATLDDASRARLGFDLGPAVSRRNPDQADRQDRRRQPRRRRCRSDRAQARQYPAGLGQVAGQVEPRRLQRRPDAAIHPS